MSTILLLILLRFTRCITDKSGPVNGLADSFQEARFLCFIIPLFLLRDSHLTQSTAEPESLSQAQADQVTQFLCVQTLLELFTMEDLDMIVESANRFEYKALFFLINNYPMSN